MRHEQRFQDDVAVGKSPHREVRKQDLQCSAYTTIPARHSRNYACRIVAESVEHTQRQGASTEQHLQIVEAPYWGSKCSPPARGRTCSQAVQSGRGLAGSLQDQRFTPSDGLRIESKPFKASPASTTL